MPQHMTSFLIYMVMMFIGLSFSQLVTYHTCTSSTECIHYALSRCSGGTCQACSSDGDCTHLSATSQCLSDGTNNYCTLPCSATSAPDICGDMNSLCANYGGYRCEYCQTTSECQAQYPSGVQCNMMSGIGYCGYCIDNYGCPSGATCKNFKCVECSIDSDCSLTRPKCQLSLKGSTCKCLSDSDCPNSAPTCTKIGVNGVETCYLIPTLTLLKGEGSEVIIIKFNKAMTMSKSLQDLLGIELMNIDTSVYTYDLLQVDSKTYKIIFKANVNLPSAQLRLEILQPDQIVDSDGLNISQTTYYFDLDPIDILSQSHKDFAIVVSKIAFIYVILVLVLCIAALILSRDSVLLWMFLNILQINYYLLYIHVQYPQNVELFLKSFSIASFQLLPNFVLLLSNDVINEGLPCPKSFADNEMNGLFFISIGYIISFWLLIIVIASLVVIVWKFVALPEEVEIFFKKIKNYLFWSGIIRILIASFTDVTFASFLQMATLYFDSGTHVIASLLGILGTIVTIATPILFLPLLKRNIGFTGPDRLKFGMLMNEYNHEIKLGRYFPTIALTRRLVLCIFTAFLSYSPLTVILTYITLDVASVILLGLKPLKTNWHTLINYTFELLSATMHVLVLSLVIDELGGPEGEIRLWTSWVVVGIGFIFLAACGIFAGVEISQSIKKAFYSHGGSDKKQVATASYPISRATIVPEKPNATAANIEKPRPLINIEKPAPAKIYHSDALTDEKKFRKLKDFDDVVLSSSHLNLMPNNVSLGSSMLGASMDETTFGRPITPFKPIDAPNPLALLAVNVESNNRKKSRQISPRNLDELREL